VDVDIGEGGHQELAVESVHDAPVARDDVAKVLDLERSFESRCKEAAEGSDDGGEKGEEEGVDEEGEEGDRLLHVKQSPPCGQCLWKGVLLLSEES